ncbi:MAG TPA: tetratricopeptide repeat protein [Bryobacteraceae bacterium]|nr:tetratricopeptide repeat protein [Bryobacteraceae bacterium]
MRFRFAACAATSFLLVMPLLAQQQPAQQQPGQQPAANQPRPKSQKEVDALKKVQADQQAQNWGQEIQDINAVLENFADTEFKTQLLNMAMDAAQRENDYPQTVVWGERVIQNDPSDITARVMLAETIAAHTRENDLDKDKSIQKIQTYANKALDLLKNASTPPIGISEAQWPEYKKQLTSQAYDALGQAADLQKKFPDSINNFKSAIEAQPTNSVAIARLAKTYVDAKQYDDAISTADKVLAMNDAPAVVKQFAQQQKALATKLKGAGTGGAAPK